MTLQAIKYSRGKLEILDQLRLPAEMVYLPIADTEAAWHAIKSMQVRGAPAIAMVGSLGLAVELTGLELSDLDKMEGWVEERLQYLVSARPTAVNMARAAHTLTALTHRLAAGGTTVADAKEKLLQEIESMLEEDISVNKRMGQHGATHIGDRCPGKVRMLTHCNTGSLATAGYGTALGVIRSLREQERLEHVYCTETRPYNQGARLTAFELVFEMMPATLICDSMAAILMERKNISAVVVGADRVVANGDTANKVGTYQLAIAAKYHGVPFYVACPLTTFDPNISSGKDIVIEERPALEMTCVKGIRIAADGIDCWNPAFDVTPAELITGGIVTEHGVFAASELRKELQQYMETA